MGPIFPKVLTHKNQQTPPYFGTPIGMFCRQYQELIQVQLCRRPSSVFNYCNFFFNVIKTNMNKWLQHVKDYRKKHPKLSYSQALKQAKTSYTKVGKAVVKKKGKKKSK